MGNKTIGQMATELQRRISQLNSPDAVAAINNALEWLWLQGSYTFQLTGSFAGAPTNSLVGQIDLGQLGLPVDVDLGKALFVANSPQGTPIEKRPIQDFSLSFAFNVPADQGFFVYTISGRNLLCRPSQTAQNVGVRYHILFPGYLEADVPPTPADADNAIISLAEGHEKRIYDVGDDWPKIIEQAQKDILGVLNAYRSVSEEAMPQTDAAVAIQEKTQAGRA